MRSDRGVHQLCLIGGAGIMRQTSHAYPAALCGPIPTKAS
jgi:hypothetical protein